MGQFPVVFVSLKNIDGLSFELAYECLERIIKNEADRLNAILNGAALSQSDQEELQRFCDRTATREEVLNSFAFFTKLLYEHYHQKVILLIDEYDVPLDKAFQHGYYQEMAALIRGLFGQTLKTNEYLYFAVLTGCMRISKESIFTELNNFKVLSITDTRFDEHFGFTDAEVRECWMFTDFLLITMKPKRGMMVTALAMSMSIVPGM